MNNKPGAGTGRRTGRREPRSRHKDGRPETFWLYGRHAVRAALENPERVIRRLVATRNAAQWLREAGLPPDGTGLTSGGAGLTPEKYPVPVEDLLPSAIDGMLPDGAVHQGLAAHVEDLPHRRLRDICKAARPQSVVLVLDQVTDPQNIGAILRSATAFGVEAVIVQDRRTPPFSGALAKAAAGGADKIPVVRVVNIARALEALQETGYHCLGLSGHSAEPLRPAKRPQASALILGSEGKGLRRLTAQTCDSLAHIPIIGGMESLNVSTAAAIALYELTRT